MFLNMSLEISNVLANLYDTFFILSDMVIILIVTVASIIAVVIIIIGVVCVLDTVRYVDQQWVSLTIDW